MVRPVVVNDPDTDPTGRIDVFLQQLGDRMFGQSNPELWDKYKDLYGDGIKAVISPRPIHPTALKVIELGVDLVKKLRK